jgi:hypothetical protein
VTRHDIPWVLLTLLGVGIIIFGIVVEIVKFLAFWKYVMS